MNRLADLEVVAFDLDNTLYDEGLYYEAAFERIAPWLAEHSGRDTARVRARLRAILRDKGKHYHYLFSDILTELGLDPKGDLPAVLDLFREVTRRLEPFPGVPALLGDLRRRYRLVLITAGQRRFQERKIELLGIAPFFEEIVFSSTLPESKPSPMPFRHLLERMGGVAPERAVYIGDNPLFDFRGSRAIGMRTVRVHNPELDGLATAPADDAEIHVECVGDVRALLL